MDVSEQGVSDSGKTSYSSLTLKFDTWVGRDGYVSSPIHLMGVQRWMWWSRSELDSGKTIASSLAHLPTLTRYKV